MMDGDAEPWGRSEEGTMNQDIINLYDEYSRGGMDRRAFLDRLAQVVGGAAAALALLPALEAAPARIRLSRQTTSAWSPARRSTTRPARR